MYFFFFFNDTATTEIYTLSLHDALPIYLLILSHLLSPSVWRKYESSSDDVIHLRQLDQTPSPLGYSKNAILSLLLFFVKFQFMFEIWNFASFIEIIICYKTCSEKTNPYLLVLAENTLNFKQSLEIINLLQVGYERITTTMTVPKY